MPQVMPTGSKLETIVVTGKVQSRSHLLIRQGPTSGHNIGIKLTALQKDSYRFPWRASNQIGEVMRSANIYKRPAMTDHTTKAAGKMPSGIKCADTAT